MKNFILLLGMMLFAGMAMGQLKVVSTGSTCLGCDVAPAKLTVQSLGNATRVAQFNGADGTEIIRLNQQSNGGGLFQFNNSTGDARVLLNPQGRSYFGGGRLAVGTLSLIHI